MIWFILLFKNDVDIKIYHIWEICQIKNPASFAKQDLSLKIYLKLGDTKNHFLLEIQWEN